jgi:hypothetical protein
LALCVGLETSVQYVWFSYILTKLVVASVNSAVPRSSVGVRIRGRWSIFALFVMRYAIGDIRAVWAVVRVVVCRLRCTLEILHYASIHQHIAARVNSHYGEILDLCAGKREDWTARTQRNYTSLSKEIKRPTSMCLLRIL